MELWLILVLIGLCLIIAELFVPGNVIIWFGFAILLASVTAFIGGGTSMILLTFIASLVFLSLTIRPAIMRGLKDDFRITNSDALVGSIGIAKSSFGKNALDGRVRVGREEWSAKTDGDSSIFEGEEVLVTRIEGVTLIVTKRDSTNE